jgi:ribosomal protein L7Ae-like RNA K-turn-binding protein
LLGLAEKAGKIRSGEFSAEKAIKSGSAGLVLVAVDASANTQKNFQDMCHYYQVPIYMYGSKEQLGHSIGKQFRASLAVIDEGFSKSLKNKLSALEKTE